MGFSQTTINLNQPYIDLISQIQLKWRDCQRKQQTYFAVYPPAGFIFANELTQPGAYRYMMGSYLKNLMSASDMSKGDIEVIGRNCYMTDGRRIMLCDTLCQFSLIEPERFIRLFKKPDGTTPDKVPTTWQEYIIPAEKSPHARGAQLPVKYLGVYDNGQEIIRLNDMETGGHFKGDILVAPWSGQTAASYGRQVVTPLHNKVFRNTYNLSIGGWARSGEIGPEDPNDDVLTLTKVREFFKFTSNTDLKAYLQSAKKQ